MARRKDLAGLAALGALGYILNNRDEPTKVQDRTGSSTASTGMGEVTQLLTPDNSSGKDYGGSSGTGDYAPGPSSMMRPEPVTKPRSRPVTRPVTRPVAAAAPAVVSDAQRQYDEANARAKTPEGRAERARMESSQALEAVRPEEAMIGGGGLKGVAALARGLANRKGATAGGEKLAQYVTPELGYSQKVLQNNPTRQLTGPSKTELVARDRAARAAGREAERKEFNQRGRDRFVESTFEGGMKRGGKVKKMASGGMARSSASSRADGIASRGKTRGKVC
jgi:hypothetical protein